MLHFFKGNGLCVDDCWLATDRGGFTVRAPRLIDGGLAAKYALKERCGFGEPARAGEAGDLDHLVRTEHVIHLYSFSFTEASEPNLRRLRMSYVRIGHHRILSARAALTAGLACSAPSTATDAI